MSDRDKLRTDAALNAETSFVLSINVVHDAVGVRVKTDMGGNVSTVGFCYLAFPFFSANLCVAVLQVSSGWQWDGSSWLECQHVLSST